MTTEKVKEQLTALTTLVDNLESQLSTLSFEVECIEDNNHDNTEKVKNDLSDLVKAAFLYAHPLSEQYPELALKEWLQYAAEKGLDPR